jgi:cell wall-associated NlpC family hydrolase
MERALIPVPDQEVRIRVPGLGRPRAVHCPHALFAAVALCAVATPLLNARTPESAAGGRDRPSTAYDSRTLARPISYSGSIAAKAAPPERAALVTYAKRFLGTPYRWGGASPAGFDCSGLTSFVYGKFGVRMAHYTRAQYAAYRKIGRHQLRPGDLVFFDGLGHTGIYVGRGRFIHATHTGDHVRISRLSERWYSQRYAGAVRPPFRLSAFSTRGPSMRSPGGMRSASSSASSA